MKECKNCKIVKHREEFYKASNKKNNNPEWDCRDSFCKQCRLDYASTRRKAIKQRAVDYKGGKCEDCMGEFPISVYDFHHLDPSQKDFAIGANVKTFDAILVELDKCAMLCSNCHRIRHYN